MPPNEEELIWNEGKRKEARLGPGTPTDDILARRFPELIRAGGGVDPQEALISVLDKITELEARVNESEGNTSLS